MQVRKLNLSFSEGEVSLLSAALRIIRARYPGLRIHDEAHDVPNIGWSPSRWFRTRDGVTVFVEASPDSLVPQIADLNYSRLLAAPEPMAVLIVCSEGAFNAAETRQRISRKHEGYGFVVVDGSGGAQVEYWGKPFVQVISEPDFRSQLEAFRDGQRLPSFIRERLSQAFENYREDSVGGVRSIAETVESIGVQLHERLIGNPGSGHKAFAVRMNELLAYRNAAKAHGAIAGARNFVSTRNQAAHPPSTRQARIQRATMAKTNFLTGTRLVCELCKAATDTSVRLTPV